MGILDEDVARVRETTDIVGLIGERVALKRVGQRFVGLCPFHSEKTPSFSVNAQLGVYHCFGCQHSGDAITFLRDLDGLDFVEAVERLASKAGITLRYDSHGQSQDRQRKDRLIEAVTAAVDFYHHILLENPEAGRARGYLRSRGFDGDAARRFSLGWAPDGYDVLARHLYGLKFSRDDIVGAGLGFVNRAQKIQDFFRARLLFPIFDRAGHAVGFGGRTLTGDGPKYKNTAETAIYHKSRLLYGLNWAKAEVGARDAVVVCEGYTDVMGFALAGIPNAVATCGTSLADEHAEILKNFTRRIILAYDADAAGLHAAERWYQWEQRYDIEVRVAALPPGRDPGDLWKDDPELLVRAVEGAPRFLQFKIDRILANADLKSPEGRARAAEEVVPVLREHPSELVREQYIPQVAGSLGIDHAWFKTAIARAPSSGPRPARVAPKPSVASSVDPRELDALRWAIHDPGLVADWLDPVLFTDPLAREVLAILKSSATMHAALDLSEGEPRRILERLAVEEPQADGEPETVRSRVMINVIEPAALRLQATLARQGDTRVMQVNQLLDRMVAARAAGEWVAGEEAASQLVRLLTHSEDSMVAGGGAVAVQGGAT